MLAAILALPSDVTTARVVTRAAAEHEATLELHGNDLRPIGRS